MKIRVPGCHGSEQVIERESGPAQCRTCGFLVNGTVMVDARTIGTALTLQEQKRIRHILLSHLHFDNLADDASEPVTLTFIETTFPDEMAEDRPPRSAGLRVSSQATASINHSTATHALGHVKLDHPGGRTGNNHLASPYGTMKR